MNSLNNRQIEFVKLLLEENNYKTINYFSEALCISCKTLQKDLKVIEEYFNNFNIVLDRKRGTGIKIINVKAAKWLLLNNLKLQENECEKIPINERRLEITRNMLIDSNKTTSIQKLSDTYYVSKTSIVSDFNYIEKWLTQFNLTLEKDVEGTRINGTEINMRKAISSLMIEYSKIEHNDAVIKDIASRLDPATFNALLQLFDEDKVIYITKYLMDLEKKYNCTINDPYYINLLTHILISLTRGLAGKQIKDDFKKDEYKFRYENSYKEALNMINTINADFNVKLGESEIYYLYQYFSSSGLFENMKKDENMALDKLNYTAKIFTEKITDCIEKIINRNISNDEMIMKDIFLHVRSMINRLNYDIQITNPLMGDIKKEYPEILNICNASALIASHALKQKNIPIDEIGYLTVYYQTVLERLSVNKRIIVVCQSGLGTSQLLATRIKKAFPQWEIAGILSVNMARERNLHDIDFIISTVPIRDIEKPYIMVSPFLNNEDIRNITNILSEKPRELNYTQLGIYYINKFLNRENIYFDKTDYEITKIFTEKYNHSIDFNDISFGDGVKIKLGFDDISYMAINIRNNANSQKQIIFYIAMNDMNIMTEIISVIYHMYKSVEFINIFKKCIDAKNVKDYFEAKSNINKLTKNEIEMVLKKETVIFNMNAVNKEEALLELSELLKKSGIISDKDKFLVDINKRESTGITGIGNGIAIPHAESDSIKETVLAIGKTKTPIKWDSLDDLPVSFIILFAVSDNDKTGLKGYLIKKVAAMLGDDEVCEKLMLTKGYEDVCRVFLEN